MRSSGWLRGAGMVLLGGAWCGPGAAAQHRVRCHGLQRCGAQSTPQQASARPAPMATLICTFHSCGRLRPLDAPHGPQLMPLNHPPLLRGAQMQKHGDPPAAIVEEIGGGVGSMFGGPGGGGGGGAGGEAGRVGTLHLYGSNTCT